MSEPFEEFVVDLRTFQKEMEQIKRAHSAVISYTRHNFYYNVPEKRDPEKIPSARQLQSEIKNVNHIIELFESALAGKIKPDMQIIEGDLMHAYDHDRIHEKENEENKEIIKAGINVLKNWRRTYVKRLNFLKLKQPMVKLSAKKADDIVKEATKTITDIDILLKEKLHHLEKLCTEYNQLSANHEKLNINPDLRLQPFPQIPTYLRDLKPLFKVNF